MCLLRPDGKKAPIMNYKHITMGGTSVKNCIDMTIFHTAI